MKRRNFIKNSITGSTGLILQPVFSSFFSSYSGFAIPNNTAIDLISITDTLAKNPPNDARPLYITWLPQKGSYE